MSSPTGKASDPRPIAIGHVTHRINAVRLDNYPLLVYGPAADPQMRIASNGTPISRVAASADPVTEFGISPEEAGEARRFVAESGE